MSFPLSPGAAPALGLPRGGPLGCTLGFRPGRASVPLGLARRPSARVACFPPRLGAPRCPKRGPQSPFHRGDSVASDILSAHSPQVHSSGPASRTPRPRGCEGARAFGGTGPSTVGTLQESCCPSWPLRPAPMTPHGQCESSSSMYVGCSRLSCGLRKGDVIESIDRRLRRRPSW